MFNLVGTIGGPPYTRYKYYNQPTHINPFKQAPSYLKGGLRPAHFKKTPQKQPAMVTRRKKQKKKNKKNKKRKVKKSQHTFKTYKMQRQSTIPRLSSSSRPHHSDDVWAQSMGLSDPLTPLNNMETDLPRRIPWGGCHYKRCNRTSRKN